MQEEILIPVHDEEEREKLEERFEKLRLKKRDLFLMLNDLMIDTKKRQTTISIIKKNIFPKSSIPKIKKISEKERNYINEMKGVTAEWREAQSETLRRILK